MTTPLPLVTEVGAVELYVYCVAVVLLSAAAPAAAPTGRTSTRSAYWAYLRRPRIAPPTYTLAAVAATIVLLLSAWSLFRVRTLGGAAALEFGVYAALRATVAAHHLALFEARAHGAASLLAFAAAAASLVNAWLFFQLNALAGVFAAVECVFSMYAFAVTAAVFTLNGGMRAAARSAVRQHVRRSGETDAGPTRRRAGRGGGSVATLPRKEV